MGRVWIIAFWTLLAGPVLAQSLQERIGLECGAPGFRDGAGCTIELAKGEILLSDTLEIGNCTVNGARPGVTIQGQGSGRSAAVGNDANTGATTLVWNGPPGGEMIDVCGAPNFTLRNLSLRMDPGEDGAAMAGIAVRLSADNRTGATTQNPIIDRIAIEGSRAKMGSIGILITGQQQNDQVDHVHISDTQIDRVGICLVQNSGQSALNQVEHLNCSAYVRGIAVLDGAFQIESSYIGSARFAYPGFVGVDLMQVSGSKAHQNVTIMTSHFELAIGTFIRIAGSRFAQNVWSNNFSLQCVPLGCEQLVLDSRNDGPVVMMGNTIGAGNRHDRIARIRHAGAGELTLIGNYKRPNVSELIIETE